MTTTEAAPVQAPERKQLTGLRGLMQAVGINAGTTYAVDSTAIAETRYDRKAMKLIVRFQSGAAYEYGSVPAAVYRELAKAESKGRFFVRNIRNRYPFRRLTAI